MHYLFNSTAKETAQTADLWLTQAGYPTLATELKSKAGENSVGTRLVGKIEADDPTPYQLTDGTELTSTGEKYCAALGVEPNVTAIKKFAATHGNTMVVLAAVIPTAPCPQ